MAKVQRSACCESWTSRRQIVGQGGASVGQPYVFHTLSRPIKSVRRCPSGTAKLILDTLDIILFQIGAGLHLDDLDRDLAGVGKPVN
jgi:hypothetical protein